MKNRYTTQLYAICTALSMLFAMAFSTSFANKPAQLIDELAKVNATWYAQPDAAQFLEGYVAQTLDERTRVRLHLEAAEKLLSERSTQHLTATQQQNRRVGLAYLRAYYQAGAFPINDLTRTTQPIFIDRFDNFCAVGYLLKMSGHEELARTIRQNGNLRLVHQIDEPALATWAETSGFTVDELALIQPGYGPIPTPFVPLGSGLNGTVYGMYYDSTFSRLWTVGNFFDTNGFQITLKNRLALYNEALGSWGGIGSGLNGPALTVTQFQNVTYVAGTFTQAGQVPVTNVVKIEDGVFYPMGQLNGKVHTLKFYNNTLYAGGEFSLQSAGNSFQNLARWDGAKWASPGCAFNGPVYALEVWNGTLYVAGKYTHCGLFPARNIMSITDNYPSTVANGTDAGIYTLAVFQNELWAGGELFTATDTFGLAKFTGNEWIEMFDINEFGYAMSINQDLLAHGVYALTVVENQRADYPSLQHLIIGGRINYNPFFNMNKSWGQNLLRFDPVLGFNGEAFVDSAVFALASTGAEYYVGGSFTNINGVEVNSIARSDNQSLVSVPQVEAPGNLSLYPNPATTQLTVNGSAQEYTNVTIYSITGAQLYKFPGSVSMPFSIPTHLLEPGTYVLTIQENNTRLIRQKFIVQN